MKENPDYHNPAFNTKLGAVIAIFWPSKEMGRNQDGLGGYAGNVLLDQPCT
jgi:hypothetical protein